MRLGQEEETNEFEMWADSIQPSGRVSDGRPEGTDATSPVTISSTSDNDSVPTRRDVSRIKSRFDRMAENLRTSVATTKTECEQALEQEADARRADREADLELQALQTPTIPKLLDERIAALGTAHRAA